MTYEPSVLERVQLAMGARMQAHPYFVNVPTFVLRPRVDGAATMIQGNLNNILTGIGVAGVNGKLGAAFMVNLPTGDIPFEEAPGPDIRFGYSVRVLENPLINMGANGTGISAEDLMLAAINLLHRWFIQWAGATMIADKNPFDPVKDFLTKNIIAYDFFFKLRIQLQGVAKTPTPFITGNVADGVTISIPEGATVYYTLDGSYPWSGNDTAVLIASSDPIAVVSGMLVQAVASNVNQQASDLAALTIP